MGLPSDYAVSSATDISHRFVHSIIEYNDYPFYVRSVISDERVALKLVELVSLKESCVYIDDPCLNICGLGRKTGAMNISENKAAFISRVPMRSMVQGMSWTNTLFGMYNKHRLRAVNNPTRPLVYDSCDVWEECSIPGVQQEEIMRAMLKIGARYELGPYFLSQGFWEMWRNNYPSVGFILKKDSVSTAVVSKRHLVVKDDFGDAYLASRGDIIGKFVKQNEVKFKPRKAYLAEEVKRILDIDQA